MSDFKVNYLPWAKTIVYQFSVGDTLRPKKEFRHRPLVKISSELTVLVLERGETYYWFRNNISGLHFPLSKIDAEKYYDKIIDYNEYWAKLNEM